MAATVLKPATTSMPVPLSENESHALIFPHLAILKRKPKCKQGYYRVIPSQAIVPVEWPLGLRAHPRLR
jgi:hypothetical protein